MATKMWRSPHDSQLARQPEKERGIQIALVMTALAFVVQVVGFYFSHSLALLGDTLHVFTDFLSLGMAFFAVRIARRAPSEQQSFGLYRVEVLASFLNGLLLLFVAGTIALEAIHRFVEPTLVAPNALLGSAVLGLLLNLLSAWQLHRADTGKQQAHEPHQAHQAHSHSHSHSHAHHDRNLHSAMLHVLSDALGSCAVIAGGIVVAFTGWQQIDSIVGFGLACLVAYWAVRVLQDTVHVLLESTPKHIEPKKLTADILAIDAHIRKVEDLHVWEITSRMYAFSAHLYVREMSLRDADSLRKKIAILLEERFGIAHPTIAFHLEDS